MRVPVYTREPFFENGWVRHTHGPNCKAVTFFLSAVRNQYFGIRNPQFLCFLHFVIQLLFPILITNDHTFQFEFQYGRFPNKKYYWQSLIVQLISQSNMFTIVEFSKIIFNVSWCLLNFFDTISMLHSGSNNTSTRVSLFDILVSLMLQNMLSVSIRTGLRVVNIKRHAIYKLVAT